MSGIGFAIAARRPLCLQAQREWTTEVHRTGRSHANGAAHVSMSRNIVESMRGWFVVAITSPSNWRLTRCSELKKRSSISVTPLLEIRSVSHLAR